VTKDARIIKRPETEVNAGCAGNRNAWRRPLTWLGISVVVLSVVAWNTGCGSDDRRAERMEREAERLVDEENFGEAVEQFQKIVQAYPDTEAAARAREAVKIYRGIVGAVSAYPQRVARDTIVRTARALERFRGRRRKAPESLAGLVPDYLPEEPVDPWGRPLVYERTRLGRGYVLACLGSDGEPGGEGDAADLVVKDGAFVSSR
jgi:general secretion pathway protein G